MSGHGTKLKRKLAEAVAAVLTARSVEDAARSVSVSTATLMRWQKLPEFQAALREARRAAFGQVIARLTQASGAAASILLKIVVDANTSASVRVRAIDSVLGHCAKFIEIEDIEARVTDLERAADVSKQAR
jgi:hypothetical protein